MAGDGEPATEIDTVVFQRGKQIRDEYFILSVHDSPNSSLLSIVAHGIEFDESQAPLDVVWTYAEFDALFQAQPDLLDAKKRDERFEFVIERLDIVEDKGESGRGTRHLVMKDLAPRDLEMQSQDSQMRSLSAYQSSTSRGMRREINVLEREAQRKRQELDEERLGLRRDMQKRAIAEREQEAAQEEVRRLKRSLALAKKQLSRHVKEEARLSMELEIARNPKPAEPEAETRGAGAVGRSPVPSPPSGTGPARSGRTPRLRKVDGAADASATPRTGGQATAPRAAPMAANAAEVSAADGSAPPGVWGHPHARSDGLASALDAVYDMSTGSRGPKFRAPRKSWLGKPPLDKAFVSVLAEGPRNVDQYFR
eukprot:gnl/TRDRNA2_/TRDRNA2_181018_c0_seq1.p1 gnl/TRDRNA2_/TRDRNA2_181018_c0~~gnl/TRDRNA2_/TRDRNA2_181018_c0_seq1.p1  ORF type:complete len:384 (-),score=65.97 gnl/TRDRNA2_/TRDRNA2_181018_c0_seq1:80-1183(-)